MNRLKLARAENGYTLRKLAEIAGMSPANLNLLENDRQKARLNTLVKLKNVLNIPLDDLLDLLDTTPVERGQAGQRALKALKQRQAQELAAPPIETPAAAPQEAPPNNEQTKATDQARPAEARPTITQVPAIAETKTSRPKPRKWWTGLENGGIREFKQLVDAQHYITDSGQRGRIYEGIYKSEMVARTAHRKFIDEVRNNRAQWSSKMMMTEIVKLPDPPEKATRKRKLGPAKCSECGKLAIEGMFLCEKHSKTV